MNIAEFLATASGLLALPSTADRPAELERALDYMTVLPKGKTVLPKGKTGPGQGSG